MTDKYSRWVGADVAGRPFHSRASRQRIGPRPSEQECSPYTSLLAALGYCAAEGGYVPIVLVQTFGEAVVAVTVAHEVVET